MKNSNGQITVTITMTPAEWRKASRVLTEHSYFMLGALQAGGLFADRINEWETDLAATRDLASAILSALTEARQ